MSIFSAFHALLRFIWKTLGLLRSVLANILFLFLLTVIISAFFADHEERLPSESILVVDPAGALVEEKASDAPLTTLIQQMGNEARIAQETRVQDVIDAIGLAAKDTRIKALILAPEYLRGNDTTKIMDIGAAIRAFKKSDKPVLANAPVYTQGQYLLASYADSVSVSPLGGVLITGYGLYQPYFKQLLDKIRLKFNVWRVGDYKSAVEPLMRDSMSDFARQENQAWLSALWGAYRGEITANRPLTADDITGYVEHIDTALAAVSGNAARLAASVKLVDHVLNTDDFDTLVAQTLERKKGTIEKIGFEKYLRLAKQSPSTDTKVVGIIRARGPIVSGEQSEDMIGSVSVSKLLQQARDDASIAAVVLRLDSPGGSVMASEDIYNEVLRTRQAGKPVVVSMGSVAASGAYWIASAADRIVAAPTTLTGSIGIFAVFPSFEDTATALGVTTDGVGTTSLADLGNPLRPMPDQAQTAIGHLLRFDYGLFLRHVAQGRGLSIVEVEKSARGQVFVGQEALRRKLVDSLGNLDDAVGIAASLAGLATPTSRSLRQTVSPRARLLQALFAPEEKKQTPNSRTVSGFVDLAWTQARFLDSLSDPTHIYARSFLCEGVNN